MDKTKQRFEIGSRVICKSWKELMAAVLMLSSKGYKIEIESLIGSMDMTEIVLTITALPEKNDQIPELKENAEWSPQWVDAEDKK